MLEQSREFAPLHADEHIAASEDRRTSRRAQTVYRVARVLAGNEEGFARIRNVSDDGVMVQLHVPVNLGDAISLTLSDGVTVSGHVVWRNGADCGIKLDQAIDSDALLTELHAHARSASGRPLRLSVAASAITRGQNGTRVVELHDISQRGMKFHHDGSFSEGLVVKVALPSGLERRGIVRWSRDGFAGLLMLEPFTPEELGSASHL